MSFGPLSPASESTCLHITTVAPKDDDDDNNDDNDDDRGAGDKEQHREKGLSRVLSPWYVFFIIFFIILTTFTL